MTPLPGYSDADRDQRRTRYTRVSNAQCIATFINISSIGKMGFTCAAAGCSSNSMKSLRKYPWMRDVSWVKWPKLLAVSHRWKRLIRRGGKGGLIVERRTRLCSRHFDAHAVGEGDPKYFAWNNWGNPITTSRALPVLRVIEKENVVVCVTVTPSTSSDQTVPGVGTEVTVDTCLPKREIGSMYTHY